MTQTTTMSSVSTTAVETLLAQLQNTSILAQKSTKDIDKLDKDRTESFVIEKAGTLVTESLDMVMQMKDFVISAPNARDVEALAGLIQATSSALESLNKLIVIDKKVAGALKVKELEGEQRRQLLSDETKQTILLSREQVLKQLIEKTSTQITDISAVVS